MNFNLILIVFATIVAETLVDSIYTPDKSFPSSLSLNLTTFDTWAQENYWNNTWTAYPETAGQIIEAANWALSKRWQLRPSGKMHTWAPFTVPNANPSGYPTKDNPEPPKKTTDGREWPLILLKTERLNKMGIISKEKGKMTFWAETGILMDDLLKNLEENEMSLLHHPAPGGLTLGGVLAIGGHGASVPAKDEKLSRGHSYGSLSNLIISLTAVVYDEKSSKFVLKEFKRTDPQIKVLLVNLGRSFVVKVTMQAGPLQYLRCQSYVHLEADELFANPNEVKPGQRTFSSFLDKTGRVESILFAFTEKPWLKVWSLTNKKGPPRPQSIELVPVPGITESRKVDKPYNYPFSDNMSPLISEQVQQIKKGQGDYIARTIGQTTYMYISGALTTYQAFDIWGKSKNVLLYIKASTLRFHANGYAILCARKNVQLVSHEAYEIYKNLIDKYEREGKYPINGVLEIRASGVDNPSEVIVDGAMNASISATSPIASNPDFDTVIWVNVMTYTRTQYTCYFMIDMEQQLAEKINGNYATVRVEWSKGWAYTHTDPWKNRTVLSQNIPSTFADWSYHYKTSRSLSRTVFTNNFLNLI